MGNEVLIAFSSATALGLVGFEPLEPKINQARDSGAAGERQPPPKYGHG